MFVVLKCRPDLQSPLSIIVKDRSFSVCVGSLPSPVNYQSPGREITEALDTDMAGSPPSCNDPITMTVRRA